jgi:catechol 2,3-dioxygenase-like lactoylglutathione lyase family enzyme
MSTNSADAVANRAKNDEANRNLASIRPSFIVKDLQTSITYYRERLGFQLDFQGPDDGPARGVFCHEVVVHRRGTVGIRDQRCRRISPFLLSAPQHIGAEPACEPMRIAFA